MSLEDKIRNELVKEDPKYLEEHLQDAKKIFSLTDSGDINIEVNNPSQKDRILIHFIGLKYAHEGGMRDSCSQHYKDLCGELGLNQSSARVALSNWKSKGFIKQPDTGVYELDASSLGEIIEFMEDKYEK
ncbi:hypothetical protein ACK3SF_01920 [Candidatus Nanosalina sp. VS9-1]|uniref:hypothetical protein n=1 Tax=Candidatus Nanosalina sp. VS9-1 TaxID=3388566 RepID=UPI0039E1EC70